MLRWLVGAIVLLIVAHFVVNELLPQLRRADRPAAASERTAAGGTGRASVCVEAASDALDSVAGELRALGPPPVDSGAWSSAVLDLGAALSRADSACTCSEPACQRAVEAVAELRGAVALYDGMTRMDAVGNPASYFERAANLLDRARRELR